MAWPASRESSPDEPTTALTSPLSSDSGSDPRAPAGLRHEVPHHPRPGRCGQRNRQGGDVFRPDCGIQFVRKSLRSPASLYLGAHSSLPTLARKGGASYAIPGTLNLIHEIGATLLRPQSLCFRHRFRGRAAFFKVSLPFRQDLASDPRAPFTDPPPSGEDHAQKGNIYVETLRRRKMSDVLLSVKDLEVTFRTARKPLPRYAK